MIVVVACGAEPASHVGRLVDAAQRHALEVAIIATPAALRFLDLAGLRSQTGWPVRSRYRQPSEQRSKKLPQDLAGVIVAPATYNTLNKWAHGINDTYALGLLAETYGLGIPVVVLPFVNTAQAANPVYARSVSDLRALNVRILDDHPLLKPHAPGTGSSLIHNFPWPRALDELGAITTLGSA